MATTYTRRTTDDYGNPIMEGDDWLPSLPSAGGALGDAWGSLSGADAAKEAADAIAEGQAVDRAYDFPNVSGPLGSQNVTRDPVTGAVTVNQSLAPQQQALVSGLYGDAGTSRQRIEDALYARSAARLDPQWQDRESQSRTRLYNMGLTEGDEAFDREARNLGTQRSDAYEQARNVAITAGGQEQSRLIDAIMRASNPGLDRYWGDSQATEAGIAQGNVMAQTPSVLDAILGIGSAFGGRK